MKVEDLAASSHADHFKYVNSVKKKCLQFFLNLDRADRKKVVKIGDPIEGVHCDNKIIVFISAEG